MRKLKLYLETSVWNFYFADDAPEKKQITLEFFDKIKQGEYEIFISDVVFDEIEAAPQNKRQKLYKLIEKYDIKKLRITEEVLSLAQMYIKENALPKRAIDDSKHAAVATVYAIDALISWNLKHLANFKRMRLINAINLKEGYGNRLELITPMEVSL